MKPFLTALFAYLILSALCAVGQVREAVPESLGGISARVYDHWTVFLHPGSGYELPVPPGVRALGEPEAAVEAIFVSPDGGFEMTAWGGLSRQSPMPHFEAEWRLARSKAGRTINYQRKAASWFVVSGTYDSGIEFYEKFTMRGNHVGGFTLTYPRSRLREFEPWVVGISKGFRLVAATGSAGEIASSTPRAAARTREMPAPSVAADSPDRPRTRARDTDLKVEATPPQRTPRTDAADPKRRADTPADSVADSVAGNRPPEKQSTARTAATRKNLPVGEKVAGKPGYVYSPFDSDKRLIEVEGFSSGTLVKCPYTMKMFRVP